MQRTFAEINLDAIEHNFKIVREHTDSLIMCVVKANAYGHGVEHVAKALDACGADYFAVADVYEAVELRLCGIDKPCLVLGYSDSPEEIIKYNIIPSVFDVENARKLSDAAVIAKKCVKIHIAFDTGMSRIGFNINNMKYSDAVIDEILEIASLPNIEIEGAFSHFTTADEKCGDYTARQFEIFTTFLQKLENKGVNIKIKHICNSAAAMLYPQYHLDMVRPGIVLYGLQPSSYFAEKNFGFISAMELKAAVTRVCEIAKGSFVGYGNTFCAPCDMRIATVSAGYADGYFRALSGVGEAIFQDKKISIAGRICMDQCMFDVSLVNNICVGDHIILFGKELSADHVASLAGTIGYELVCAVARRVPRIYYHKGKKISEVNMLLENIVH